MTNQSDARLSSPAVLRNRGPILYIVRHLLPAQGVILEVASGSGEHITYFDAENQCRATGYDTSRTVKLHHAVDIVDREVTAESLKRLPNWRSLASRARSSCGIIAVFELFARVVAKAATARWSRSEPGVTPSTVRV